MPNPESPNVGVTVIALPGGHVPMAAVGDTVPAKTAPHLPDLAVTVISPLMAILIRLVNNYLTILVGLIAAGMTSDVIPAADFTSLVVKCAGLSVAGAGLGLLKDCVTIFGRLEGKYPLVTGNV